MALENIDHDDEIFFGLPEDEINFTDVDYLWELPPEDVQLASFGNLQSSAVPSTSKKGAKSRSKSPAAPRLQCTHCPKTYANERTLKTHLKTVAFKETAQRAPSYEKLETNMKDLCISALTEVSQALTVGNLAIETSSYANRVAVYIVQCDAQELLTFLSKELFEAFQFQNSVLLSSLRSSINSATNKLLNSSSFRLKLKELFNNIIECSNEGLNFFIGNFVMSLSSKVLIHAAQVMQDRAPAVSGPCQRSKDDFSSAEFKKIVYYIGGSVVCGINRRRRNYPSSSHIKNFASVMNSTFLEDEDDPSTLCDPEVKDWTELQDRGGLSFINQNAMKFFSELISLILCHEEEDGSIYLEKVYLSVGGNEELLKLWDLLVGSVLGEDVSLEWLTAIVEVVWRCVGKGVIKRRLNEALKKPTTNVALRPILARS